MKIFQIDGRPEILEFTNFHRIAEDKLFQTVMDKLKANPQVEIGEKVVGPSEDIYHCAIDGKPFTLFFDTDYGSGIRAEDQNVRNQLIKYFEEDTTSK